MNWRNPKVELPKANQKVWVMLEPHKARGTLVDSAPSIQIVCGWASYSQDNTSCIVDNNDELGHGSVSWSLSGPEDGNYNYGEYAIAWLPIEEMPLPKWSNEK